MPSPDVIILVHTHKFVVPLQKQHFILYERMLILLHGCDNWLRSCFCFNVHVLNLFCDDDDVQKDQLTLSYLNTVPGVYSKPSSHRRQPLIRALSELLLEGGAARPTEWRRTMTNATCICP